MSKAELYDEAELMVREYAGMHHMRNTQERWTILRYIANASGRFTAQDLVGWVKPYYISRATVYNSLALFEKAHVVQCLHKQHNGRLMEYEFALGDQCAMQIICTKCGRVSNVSDRSTQIALRIKNYPNFIMRHYSVYVFGECKTCKKFVFKS